MDEFLKEILSQDETLITRREDLLKVLDEKVPNNLRRSYAAIRKALTLNVGEIFAVGGDSLSEKKSKVRQILKDSGMQDSRIDGVIETFVNALDLQEEPPEDSSYGKFIPAQDQPEIPRQKAINLTKSKEPSHQNNLTKKIETPVENFQQNIPQNIPVPQNNIQPQIQKNIQTQTPEVEDAPYEDEYEEPAEENFQEPARQIPQNNFDNFNYGNYDPMYAQTLNTIFTMKGRLNRWRYVTKSLKIMAMMFVAGIVSAIASPVGGIMFLALFFGGLAISVRRLHDLNKSGWWMLISFIPYVDVIFALYLLFAKGTDGPNQYGDDPLLY